MFLALCGRYARLEKSLTEYLVDKQVPGALKVHHPARVSQHHICKKNVFKGLRGKISSDLFNPVNNIFDSSVLTRANARLEKSLAEYLVDKQVPGTLKVPCPFNRCKARYKDIRLDVRT